MTNVLARLGPALRVRHHDQCGTTVNDLMDCCTAAETPVVFDGTSSFVGISTGDLTVLGPEAAVADFAKCGGGQGADCCKFLAVGASGLTCERFGSLRYTLFFKRDMVAQREPVEPYPHCQNK